MNYCFGIDLELSFYYFERYFERYCLDQLAETWKYSLHSNKVIQVQFLHYWANKEINKLIKVWSILRKTLKLVFFKDRLQISLVIVTEFVRINQLLFDSI